MDSGFDNEILHASNEELVKQMRRARAGIRELQKRIRSVRRYSFGGTWNDYDEDPKGQWVRFEDLSRATSPSNQGSREGT